ncbi:hypothetical protein JCM10207_005511 [Rhodosporidiobolus poonsookiae]
MVRYKHSYLLTHLVFPSLPDHLPLLDLLASSPTTPTDAPAQQPPTVSESQLITLLRDSLSVNFGDVGAGEVGGTFSIKYFSPSTSTLIVRVAREHRRTLWAALTLLRKVGGVECVARVVHSSGTIRKTQHAAIAHDRAQLLLAHKRRRLQLKRSASATVRTAPNEAKARDELEEKLRKSEEEILAMEQ